jgi:hypothetical protein
MVLNSQKSTFWRLFMVNIQGRDLWDFFFVGHALHSPGKGGLSSTQEEEDKAAAKGDVDGKFYHDLAPEVKLGDDQVRQ